MAGEDDGTLARLVARHIGVIAPRTRARLFFMLAGCLTAIGAARVVATYRVFCNTMDEPYHIAAGLEWLQTGSSKFAGEHPPLGRIAAAIGPYARGLRVDRAADYSAVAVTILFQHDAYRANLFYARLGMLVFFIAAVVGVVIWTHQLFGASTALLAVLLFTTTPAVLAHAGLATTDIPLVATLTWAVLALTRFIVRPSAGGGIAVGAATGLALVSKMSALLFLPTVALTLVAIRWVFEGHRRVPQHAAEASQIADATHGPQRPRPWAAIGIAAAVAFLIVWATYRFAVGRRLWSFIPGGIPLPAPAFIDAITALLVHNAVGHPGYLIGEFRTTGWWYFFPFALLVKSPLPLLLLVVLGTVVSIRDAWLRRRWQSAAPIAVALALVIVSLPISINIGLRHILPVFPFLAMTGAYGARWLWTRRRRPLVARCLAVGLIAWQSVESIRAHPDYLAYFNELAGSHPERLLLDSDLDWGQDLFRLADTVRVRRIGSLHIAYFGSADPARLLPTTTYPLQPGERVTGWVAASETFLSRPSPALAGYRWLNGLTPTARIGKTIKLFYIAPTAASDYTPPTSTHARPMPRR